MEAQRGRRGIILLFLQARCQRHAPAVLPTESSVSNVQEVGWAPVPVWTCAENVAPTGIRSSDRPDRSESLYSLSYPGPPIMQYYITYILHNSNVWIEVKVKVKFTPEQATKAQRWSRGISVLFL